MWLRALYGSGGRGALRTSDQILAERWVEHWNGWGNFIASRYAGSRMFTWLSVWNEGEPIGGQMRERLYWEYRDLSPSGVTGYTGAQRTVLRDDLVKLAISSITAVDRAPHGPYGVDMLIGDDGVARITEVQGGRFFVSTHFLATCGLNLPLLAVLATMKDHRLGAFVPPENRLSPIQAGIVWTKYNECLPKMYDDDMVEAIQRRLAEFRDGGASTAEPVREFPLPDRHDAERHAIRRRSLLDERC